MNKMNIVVKEIWVSLPVWFIFYITASTLFCYISLLKVPRPDYGMTFIFPYSLFLLFYCARFSADEGLDRGTKIRSYFIVAGSTSALLAAAAVLSQPLRFGPDWASHFDASVWGYERSNILWTLLLAVHCYLFQGWKKFLLFFGVAFLYGIILESSGVTMGFFSEDHYHLYLPGLSAPVATMFGWSTVFYPCVFLLDGLSRCIVPIRRRSFIWQGLLVALIALSFDALIDPFATDFGLWVWNGAYHPGNSLYWCGVPLVNFVSWFTAVFTFGTAYYFFDLTKTMWDGLKKTAAMLCSLPLILIVAGIVEFGTLGMIEGFDGPSWSILTEHINKGMPLSRPPRTGKMTDNEGH